MDKLIDKYLQELYIQEEMLSFTKDKLQKIKRVFETGDVSYIKDKLSFIPNFNISKLRSIGNKVVPNFELRYKKYYKKVNKNEDINQVLAMAKAAVSHLEEQADSKEKESVLEQLQKYLSQAFTKVSLNLVITQIIMFAARLLGFATITSTGGLIVPVFGIIATILFICIIIVWIIRLIVPEKRK